MVELQELPTKHHPIGVTYDKATRRVWVACYVGALDGFRGRGEQAEHLTRQQTKRGARMETRPRSIPAGGSILGTRVNRVEDDSLLRGEGTFVENLELTGAAHVVFVRSSDGPRRCWWASIRPMRSTPPVWSPS
jgi:hypothetical protein